MVSLVLISHSRALAEGLRQMVLQVGGEELTVACAGGTDDGRLGTSAPLIEQAIRDADSVDGVLVLLDLGSAALSLEVALEALEPWLRERVRVSEGPLVEGAVLAAVEASIGSPLARVAEAADRGAQMPKMPRD